MKKLFLLIPALVLSLITNAQTDFSSPYNCSADDGVISGDAPSNKVYLNETADPHQIEWSDVSQEYTSVISWSVSVSTPCYISVSLDLGTAVSSNKHIFQVKVLDAGSNELGVVEEGPAYTGDGFTEAEQVKALSGKILLPAAGNYTIELRNNRNFCKGSIKNIILSYAGAAPVTDFESPYSCAADDAVFSGTISSSFGLNTEADPHYIFWSDRALSAPAAASWNIIATRACYISASLDLGPAISSNKHIFEVYVKDADGNEIGMVKEAGENTDSEQVKVLDGKIFIPAAGNYTIELKNNRDFGKGAIKNVILSYAGAAPITDFSTPYSCAADDAVLNGTISSSFGLNTEADPHYIFWSDRALSAPAAASWNIVATRACYISASLDLGPVISSNKHIFEVYLKDADGNELGMLTEGSESTESEQVKVLGGTLAIPAAGNYTIELKNNRDFGKGSIKNVILSYAGGEVQAMPGTTNIADAWFSAQGIRADGKIDFPDGSIQDGWVKWNVSFANPANYNVKVNIENENGHNYTVALYENESDEYPITISEGSQKSTIGTLDLGAMEVPAGNYILKVTNAIQYSDAKLISVQFAHAGGGVIDIPGTIALNEAILSTRAFIDGDGLHFTDDDHLGHISDEYAKWNIHVAADGMYKFTANCSSSNYSNLTIMVLQSGVEKYSFTPEYTYTGEKAINSPEWFLEAGNYELKLSNPADHSNGYLTSLSAAAVEGILVVDELATDMTYINEKNGQSMKPLLKRTFKGGMYNTVLFPFNNVSDAELAEIFGEGYELIELTSAALNESELVLNFESVNLSSDTYGRPYLIKPTHDVVNPMFHSHTIYKSVSHLVKECDMVKFIGSFIAGEVPAGENNLFLGPNDKLYFSPDAATPIKGTRAYFQVNVPNAAHVIKHARIAQGEQILTAIDLVNGGNNKVQKVIENGQLIIIRDGVRYNVMGVRVE